MPTIDDLRLSTKIRALGFGKYKIGKTVGAATWPRPNFMCFDKDGLDSLLNPVVQKLLGPEQLKTIRYQYFRETAATKLGLAQGHNAFDDACKYFDSEMKPGNVDAFDTWVIDSGSSLIGAARLKAVILIGGKEYNKLSKTWEKAQQYGLLVPVKQDYGAERSMVEQFIDMVLATDKHVLFLCHEREESDDAGNTEAVVPFLTGQSRETVPNKFQEVWRVKIKKVGPITKRVIQTEPGDLAYCGSRLGVPNETEFTFKSIQEALNANDRARPL